MELPVYVNIVMVQAGMKMVKDVHIVTHQDGLIEKVMASVDGVAEKVSVPIVKEKAIGEY